MNAFEGENLYLCTYRIIREKSINYSYGAKMPQSLLEYYRGGRMIQSAADWTLLVCSARAAYQEIVVVADVRILKKFNKSERST